MFAGLVLTGCTSDEPTWALDVMFVVPDGPDEVRGTQTWQVYRKAWKRNFREKHYLCSVLVTFDGVSSTPDCPNCLSAATVTPEQTDSDCDATISTNPTFSSLQRVGFGPLAVDGGPYPGSSSAGYVDYGAGWEVHGWAYPDALDQGGSLEPTAWNDSDPFAMAPAFVWELTAQADAAAMSRLSLARSEASTP